MGMPALGTTSPGAGPAYVDLFSEICYKCTNPATSDMPVTDFWVIEYCNKGDYPGPQGIVISPGGAKRNFRALVKRR